VCVFVVINAFHDSGAMTPRNAQRIAPRPVRSTTGQSTSPSHKNRAVPQAQLDASLLQLTAAQWDELESSMVTLLHQRRQGQAARDELLDQVAALRLQHNKFSTSDHRQLQQWIQQKQWGSIEGHIRAQLQGVDSDPLYGFRMLATVLTRNE
jgi:hypothetical protein